MDTNAYTGKSDVNKGKNDVNKGKGDINKGEVDSQNGTNDENQLVEADTNSNGKLNRRNYLKAGGASLAIGASIIPGTTSAASVRQGIQFQSVINAVDDLGMDPTGNSAIDSKLQRSLNRGNELIEFPPGEYLVTDGAVTGSVTNWGILGLGSDPTAVRFLHTSGNGLVVVKTNGGRGQLVENVTMDYSRQKSGTIGLYLRGNDNVNVIDVHFVGFNPTTNRGDTTNLTVQAFDPNGEALAEGIVRTGPSTIASHQSQGPPSNSAFFWLGDRHRGTLKIKDWHIENTGGNGIYASRTSGTVQVEDSLFVNNNQSSVRISGADSYCRNCVFIIDTHNDHPDNEYAEGDYINPNAMMWESGNEGNSGALIEGCDFVFRSRPNNRRTLRAVRGLGNIGDFEVRDTRFLLDTANTMAVFAQNPENPSFGSTASRPWNVTLDSVSITGSADASSGAVELYNRAGSVITNSCLHLTGNQNGIVITDSQNCRIEDTNINVGGQETVFSNSTVETSNLTSNESCPAPNLTISDPDGSDDTSSDTHELVIHGPGRDSAASQIDYRIDYQIAYEGSATPITGRSENVKDGLLEGSVWYDFTDSFEIDGEVTAVEMLSDEATLEYNGEVVSPEHFPVSDDDDGSTDDGSTDDGSTDDGSTDDGSTDDGSTDDGNTNEPSEIHELIIHGPGRDSAASQIDYRIDYRIAYEGSATPITGRSENVKDGLLEGSVWYDFTDSFEIDGEVTAVEMLSDEATLEYNGEVVSPEHFPVSDDDDGSTDDGSTDDGSTDDGSTDDGSTDDGSTDDGNTNEPSEIHELIIHGPGRDSAASQIDYRIDYRIAYEGSATPITGRSENVKDGLLEGSVWLDFTDSFEIDGEVIAVEMLSDEATLEYNGEVVDRDYFSASDDDGESTDSELPNVLLVDGTITDQVSTYSFSVTGEVQQSDELSEGQDRSVIDEIPDIVSDGTVKGIVKKGIDGYRFSGDITTMQISGNAVINLSKDE